MKLKHIFDVLVFVLGNFVVSALGGWDFPLETLVVFMVIDYLTGLYIAGVLHKSPKTKSGKLSSSAGWHGLFKKVMIIVIVAMMYRLDLWFDINYLRIGTITAYAFNEAISILENFDTMGIYIPDIVKKGIEFLNEPVDEKEGENNEDKS